jgi:threonine/homoserine/homoserine lactone efflux protein
VVTFLTLLPMAFVMIAGPQILSAIFLATSDNWRANSLAYVAGAACSITIIASLAYFFINGVSGDGPSDTVYYAIVALLLVAMVRTYLKRDESEPPKWMGKLQEASPKFSFRLGFLLLGVFPTDILTSVAVGSYLGNHGDPWWHVLPFIALTLLFLATPALILLLFGERGQRFMPKARQWMNDNSWVVNEIVLALFVVISLQSALG